jgi:hypothetical protein
VTVVGKTAVHLLVSQGWDDAEELLVHHIEHPAECDNVGAFCEYGQWLDEIGYPNEPHLREPGDYPSFITWDWDYFGEYDATVHEGSESDPLVFAAPVRDPDSVVRSSTTSIGAS